MGRRETRECAMKLLYQIQIQKEDVDEQIQRFCEENALTEGAEHEYLMDVVQGVLKHAQELDGVLEKHARGWTVSRMPRVDLAIMRLSTYELLYRTDIPSTVSINEAVELSKKYSIEGSKSFVNGVLGKILSEKPKPAEAGE